MRVRIRFPVLILCLFWAAQNIKSAGAAGGTQEPPANVLTTVVGAPGGTNGAVQYNASGAFGGDAANFYWNDSTTTLTIGSALTNGSIIFSGGNYNSPTGGQFTLFPRPDQLAAPTFHAGPNAQLGTIGLDIFPYGNPPWDLSPGLGVAWQDTCNNDNFLTGVNNHSYTCVRLGIAKNYALVGASCGSAEGGSGSCVPMFIEPFGNVNTGIGLVASNWNLPTAVLDVGGPIRSRSNSYVTSPQSITSAALASLAGLSSGTLAAGKTYSYDVDLYFSSCNANYGVKVDMGASANVSSLVGSVEIYSTTGVTSSAISTYNTAVGINAACTHVHMSGVAAITSSAGALTPRAAQNTAGPTSTTIAGGSMIIRQLN